MKDKTHQSVMSLLQATLPNTAAWSHLLQLPVNARGSSWYEDPRKLAAYHRERRRQRIARRKLRRVRRQRGQNLRTGAPCK